MCVCVCVCVCVRAYCLRQSVLGKPVILAVRFYLELFITLETTTGTVI